MSVNKEELHQIVDQLSDEQVAVARASFYLALAAHHQIVKKIIQDLLARLPTEATTEDTTRARALLESLLNDGPEPEDERAADAAPWPVERRGRVLTSEDLFPAEPIMPDDETPDMLNEAVRQWRHEGGYA